MYFLGNLGKIRCSVNENRILFAQNIILTHIKKTSHKKLASKKRKVSIKLVRKQRITKAQLYFKDTGLLAS